MKKIFNQHWQRVLLFTVTTIFLLGAFSLSFGQTQPCADKDYDCQLAQNTKAITANPNSSDGFFGRANTYSLKEDYPNAVKDFTKAIELMNPPNAEIYSGRAEAYYELKKYDQSISDYTKAIAIDSTVADYYYYRGVAYHDKGNSSKAVDDYAQTLKLDPTFTDAKEGLEKIVAEETAKDEKKQRSREKWTNFGKALDKVIDDADAQSNKQASTNSSGRTTNSVNTSNSSASGTTSTSDLKVGDRIKTPDNNAPATIVKIQPGWLTVKYDGMNGEYEIMSSGNIALLGANDKPISGNKTSLPNNNQTQTESNGNFKVGDRVKVTKSGVEGVENLQPCTITKGLVDRSYEVRCDPWGGLPYMDYTVFSRWVYPWAGASSAPKFGCSFDAPGGMSADTAAPSAQLFQRVIYERLSAAEKARMGLQFTTFQMGTPFKNVMTGRGLIKDAVPEDAMFYPIKAQYTTCKEGGGDYNYRRVTKENFGCYKNRFGEWMCGTDGVPEFIENQDVPKNQ